MKWISALFLMSLFLVSCDNELVVTDEWQDISVVWALLNKSDTAHYIRVEKAYLDPTTSALDIARIPDSLYYENAVVTLKRIATGQEFTLTRVNGDLEGYPREGGTFAETPNYLYKIKANQINLVIGEKYEFRLLRNDNVNAVTAETFILAQPVLRTPQTGTKLDFKYNTAFNFKWNETPNAGIYDIQMRFNYQERSPETNNIFVPLNVSWTVARTLQELEYKMDGTEFYNNVASNIEEDIDAQRIFEGVDIILWCAGEELEEFIRVTQANTGITSTQDIPRFTNLSEGIGIFTSRNFSNNADFQLTDKALDSLKNGVITGHLNFQ